MSARRKLAEPLPGVPIDWAAQVINADDRVLNAFGPARISAIVADGEMFFQMWGKQARRLGWTAQDLFSVHPIAPSARFDVMGLLPVLFGSTVRQLSADSALIASPAGGRLTFTREPLTGGVLIWDVR